MNFTKLDFQNARTYALQHLLLAKLDQFKASHPHIFNHVVLTSRSTTNDDYYVPPRLQQQCIVATLKFNQIGCRKVACFPYKQGAKHCERNRDATQWVRYGDQHTLACQPACFHLYHPDPQAIDTTFRNGKCQLQNFLVKLYALKPQSRASYTLSVTEDENLALNDHYCKGHGLQLIGGECSETKAQTAGEIFVGHTVYRSLNVALIDPPKYVKPPVIPTDVLTVSNWQRPSKKVKRALEEEQQNFETDDEQQMVLDMAKEIAADLGVDASVSRIAHLLRKTIPREMMKRVSSSTLITILSYKIPVKSVASSLKALGTALSVLEVVYTLASISFLITDLIDPGKFMQVLNTAQLKFISRQLHTEFRRMVHDTDMELTPEIIMALIDQGETDAETVQLVEDRIEEYLNSLDENAFGERLRIQEKNYEKEMRRIQELERQLQKKTHLIYHFLVTSVCLFLSVALSQFLKYIIVLYVIFVVAYNHKTETYF